MSEKREELSLKWGTLKSWRLNDDGPAKAALRRFVDLGMSFGAAQQVHTPEHIDALCDLIDGLDADTVYLEWDGEHVSKEAAKEYVRGYDR